MSFIYKCDCRRRKESGYHKLKSHLVEIFFIVSALFSMYKVLRVEAPYPEPTPIPTASVPCEASPKGRRSLLHRKRRNLNPIRQAEIGEGRTNRRRHLNHHKKREGDGATPEGEFYVFTKNDKSAYYLSLGLSYPNVEDAERGLRDGLISRQQHDAIVRALKRKATPPQNTAPGWRYLHTRKRREQRLDMGLRRVGE